MPYTDEPFSLVIFGASGDLTHRKLMPALWSLYAARTLPEPFAIVGTARSEMSDDAYRARVRDGVTRFARLKIPSQHVWDRFAGSVSYVAGDPTSPELYGRVKQRLEQIESARGGLRNRLFYCATPPSLYDDIVANLGAAGLSRVEGGWTRIIVEKPFGRDLESARALNQEIASVFDEDQVYRIDHYLGKETVQNILVFRFANGIFEPLWNRNHVAEVQITVAETIGVEGRGSYYEESGALRDMVQNHMLQLLCLIAMEPPVTFDADPVRDEKNKVMHAIRPIDPAKVDDVALRAQYGPGYADGKAVPGYRQ
jgi:glucose-6-phosphate 1-dehydrogenase